MHSSEPTPGIAGSCLLIGARVRWIKRGEPFYGVIVQVDGYGGHCTVAPSDGKLVRFYLGHLELAQEVSTLGSPYRGEPR
jgi:hypothetical protein